MKKDSPNKTIYQLKITIKESRLPIWRRLLIENTATLADLHQTIQNIFGWTDYHLHEFVINEQHYGVPDPEWDKEGEVLEDNDYSLDQLIDRAGRQFTYTYDFGDNWDHTVLVEKILEADPKQQYPICIKGKRAGPPEDSGSIFGYYEKLKIMDDPDHPEHKMITEWMPERFDPDEFDLEEVNYRLKVNLRD